MEEYDRFDNSLFKEKGSKFGAYLFNGKVVKVCPKCRNYISDDMIDSYNKEWCPYCGFNHK